MTISKLCLQGAKSGNRFPRLEKFTVFLLETLAFSKDSRYNMDVVFIVNFHIEERSDWLQAGCFFICLILVLCISLRPKQPLFPLVLSARNPRNDKPCKSVSDCNIGIRCRSKNRFAVKNRNYHRFHISQILYYSRAPTVLSCATVRQMISISSRRGGMILIDCIRSFP